MEGSWLDLSCCISFNLTRAYFLISVVHSLVEESCGPLNWGPIFLLYMVTYMLVKVAMNPWPHIRATKINAPDVIRGNTWYLVDYFGIEESWILPSYVYFNTVTFGSWTWRCIIVFFLFIDCLFGITKCLVAPVSTIVLCEDGGDRIGCCKISLVFHFRLCLYQHICYSLSFHSKDVAIFMVP